MRTNFTKIAVGLRSDALHSGTLDAAVNLSKVFDCSVHLICFDDNCNVYETMIQEKASLSTARFEIERRSKESVKEILKATRELEADLLIVPADKNSQTLINELDIPVLTVRDDFDPKPIKHIVIPMHDKPDTRQKIPVTAEIAKHFGAIVDMFAMSGTGADSQKRVKAYAHQAQKYIADEGVECSYHFEVGGKIDKDTIRYANEKNADLIVIMNDRDAGFFSKSFSEKIINSTDIPVLTVEPRDLKKAGAAGY